jgi:hypothetical protein
MGQLQPAGNVFCHGSLTLSGLSRDDTLRLFIHDYVLVAGRPS